MSVVFENVTYTPPGGDRPVLENFNAKFEAGRCTAITGPSGSGKTTLLSLASLLVAPDEGTVWVVGKDTGAMSEKERQEFRQKEIGMLFQTARVFSRLTVQEHLHFASAGDPGRSAKADRLLQTLGLQSRQSAVTTELSGGERARLAALLATLKSPSALLADEPTAALDEKNSETMMRLLAKTAERGPAACLLVTHDPVAIQKADISVQLSKTA